MNRRRFLRDVTTCGLAATMPRIELNAAADPPKPPQAPDHTLTVIAGTPRERGREYGRKFKDGMTTFLEREINQAFAKSPPSRDNLLVYARACQKRIGYYSPTIMEELEGMAEGSGLRLEEVVLITLHEELYHKGVPAIPHCTVAAAGPPETTDGHSYVGQTWDWMQSVYGMSQMLLWKRTDGPSVLAYAYPGLWIGAGLNSAGIALCWTSADLHVTGPRVGIPSYVIIAQILYQDSMDAAVEEAFRAKNAGWFTFVLADRNGELVNIEGSPKQMVIERERGIMARSQFGTRLMVGTPTEQPVKYHPQCARMWELLGENRGKLDRAAMQRLFGDHRSTICKHFGTLDAMLFDCTARVACVTRGPGCSGRWKEFRFDT